MFLPNARTILPLIAMLSFGLFVLFFAAVLWIVMNVVATILRREWNLLPSMLLRAAVLSGSCVSLGAMILFCLNISVR